MRKNLLLLCLLTMAAYASAERVDADRALQVATAAVHGQKQLRGDQADALKLVYTATDNGALRSAGETVYYYVFNVGTDDGFIIVAGDDIATPILGYSRSGGYDAANLPPAFAGWMKGTAGQIADAVRQGITQSSDTRRQWDAYTGGTAQAIYYAPGADYLVTTIWDQGAPFNGQTPTIGTAVTVTGCVATTMAQIMNFHQWPATKGTGIIPGYTVKDITYDSPLGDIDLDNGAAFDWTNMADDYSGTTTDAQKSAVAYLMHIAGRSVKMAYGISASGANTNMAGTALIDYFGYDKGITGYQRSNYSTADWEQLLIAEYQAGRPVIYSGSSVAYGGHAFICDGYRAADNTFHFNWGWGGGCDGFYTSTPIAEYPVGSGNVTGDFSSGQSILANIKKDDGGAAVYNLSLQEGTSLTISSTEPARGEDVTVNVPVINSGVNTFIGSLSYELVDAIGNSVYPVGTYGVFSLPAGAYFADPAAGLPVEGPIPADIPGGIYTVRVLYQIIGAATGTYLPVPDGAADLTVTIADASDLQVTGSIMRNPNLIAGDTATIAFTITNNAAAGEGDFSGTLELSLFDADDDVVEDITLNNVALDGRASATYEFMILTLPPAGNYKAEVYKKAASDVGFSLIGGANELLFTVASAQYALTVAPASNGTVMLTEGDYSEGANIIVTVTPDSGYELDELYYMSNGQKVAITLTNGEYTFQMPAHDVEVTGTFKAENSYGINTGTFTGGSLDASTTSAIPGTSVLITVNPEPGYALDTLAAHKDMDTNTTVALTDNKDGTWSFTMPDYDVTFVAIFSKNADQQAVDNAKKLIEDEASFTVEMDTANTDVAVKAWLVRQINPLIAQTGITIAVGDITIATGDFTAAVEGRAGEQTVGSFTFSVALKLTNSALVTAVSNKGVITPNLLVDAAPPVINSVSTDRTVPFDEPVILSVDASSADGGAISWEWFQCDDTAGSNAVTTGRTDANFMPVTSAEGTFYYYVVVTNTNTGVGGTQTATWTSPVITLVVEAPIDAAVPTITRQPESWTGNPGITRTLTVEASISDAGTLSYQWYKNSGAMGGETGTALVVPIDATGSNDYYVEVKNTNTYANRDTTATATSQTATITVNNDLNAEAPVITQVSQSQTVAKDAALQLTVAATVTDGGTLSYQWYANTTNTNAGGTAIAGATAAAYDAPTDVEGMFYYYVVVTNTLAGAIGTNATTSAAITITVQTNAQAPVITTQPQSASVAAGIGVTLTVVANSPDGGTLSYQWYNGAGAINGATSAGYPAPTATAGTTDYYVIVTNTNTGVSGNQTATTTSATATVTVTDPIPPVPPVATYAVTVASTQNGSVTASPTSAGAGDAITLTITPSSGYQLDAIAAYRTGSSGTTVALSGSGNTRSFTMPAYGVTVEATFITIEQKQVKDGLEEDKTLIEGGRFRIAQATANMSDPLQTWLVNTLNVLFGYAQGIHFRSTTLADADVTLTNVVPALAGTETNPGGTNGTFTFTVTLAGSGVKVTTVPTTGVIVATPYSGVLIKSVELLNMGELAVNIINSGNTPTDALALSLSGTDGSLFTVLPATLDNLAVGEETTLMLTPATTLGVRNYTLTLTAESEGMTPVSIDIVCRMNAVGIVEVEVLTLRASATASGLLVSGLTAGEEFRVYNMQGQLFFRGKATGDKHLVPLRQPGIYVVTDGKATVKAVF